jgi:hypothetical protein
MCYKPRALADWRSRVLRAEFWSPAVNGGVTWRAGRGSRSSALWRRRVSPGAARKPAVTRAIEAGPVQPWGFVMEEAPARADELPVRLFAWRGGAVQEHGRLRGHRRHGGSTRARAADGNRFAPRSAGGPGVVRVTCAAYHAGRNGGPERPLISNGFVEHLTADIARIAASGLLDGTTQILTVRSVGGAVNPHRREGHGLRPSPPALQRPGRQPLGHGGSGVRPALGLDRLRPHLDGLYLSFQTDPRPERLANPLP